MSEPTATPEMYARVFEGNPEGAVVLADLVARFGGDPYVRGGQEAERETCRKLGQRNLLDFILLRINQANGFNESQLPEIES